MPITDRTIPYEVLIRFGDDGLIRGGHYQDRRIVEIDGERVMDQPGYAKPLGASPDDVKALLPGAALTAFSEIDRLNAVQAANERQAEAMQAQLGGATDAAQIAQAAVARLTADLEAAHLAIEQGNHLVARLQSDLADSDSEVDRLTAIIDEQAEFMPAPPEDA